MELINENLEMCKTDKKSRACEKPGFQFLSGLLTLS